MTFSDSYIMRYKIKGPDGIKNTIFCLEIIQFDWNQAYFRIYGQKEANSFDKIQSTSEVFKIDPSKWVKAKKLLDNFQRNDEKISGNSVLDEIIGSENYIIEKGNSKNDSMILLAPTIKQDSPTLNLFNVQHYTMGQKPTFTHDLTVELFGDHFKKYKLSENESFGIKPVGRGKDNYRYYALLTGKKEGDKQSQLLLRSAFHSNKFEYLKDAFDGLEDKDGEVHFKKKIGQGYFHSMLFGNVCFSDGYENLKLTSERIIITDGFPVESLPFFKPGTVYKNGENTFKFNMDDDRVIEYTVTIEDKLVVGEIKSKITRSLDSKDFSMTKPILELEIAKIEKNSKIDIEELSDIAKCITDAYVKFTDGINNNEYCSVSRFRIGEIETKYNTGLNYLLIKEKKNVYKISTQAYDPVSLMELGNGDVLVEQRNSDVLVINRSGTKTKYKLVGSPDAFRCEVYVEGNINYIFNGVREPDADVETLHGKIGRKKITIDVSGAFTSEQFFDTIKDSVIENGGKPAIKGKKL